MPTNLLKYLVKVKGLPGPAGNWQDNIRIPMLWRICLNQWEKNSWHGRAQLLLLSIEMISQNLLKSFQMIPRNWNSYTLLYLPQSYEKEKKYPWNGWNTECQLFPSLNKIHILMKLDEMGNQVSRCMLYCVWAFISNCPWHFNSQILLWCNILHERILDIFVSIIGRRAKCQLGRHERHLCEDISCIYLNIIDIIWKYIWWKHFCLNHGGRQEKHLCGNITRCGTSTFIATNLKHAHRTYMDGYPYPTQHNMFAVRNAYYGRWWSWWWGWWGSQCKD